MVESHESIHDFYHAQAERAFERGILRGLGYGAILMLLCLILTGAL